tara:strand:+ start:688 stop:900 length:213 start_codon:yes stop_codon:yes gene_type:complete
MEERIIKQLTKISTIQETTSEDIKEIKSMLKEQNGRVRANESSIAKLNTVASLCASLIISYLAWFFGFKQ